MSRRVLILVASSLCSSASVVKADSILFESGAQISGVKVVALTPADIHIQIEQLPVLIVGREKIRSITFENNPTSTTSFGTTENHNFLGAIKARGSSSKDEPAVGAPDKPASPERGTDRAQIIKQRELTQFAQDDYVGSTNELSFSLGTSFRSIQEGTRRNRMLSTEAQASLGLSPNSTLHLGLSARSSQNVFTSSDPQNVPSESASFSGLDRLEMGISTRLVKESNSHPGLTLTTEYAHSLNKRLIENSSAPSVSNPFSSLRLGVSLSKNLDAVSIYSDLSAERSIARQFNGGKVRPGNVFSATVGASLYLNSTFALNGFYRFAYEAPARGSTFYAPETTQFGNHLGELGIGFSYRLSPDWTVRPTVVTSLSNSVGHSVSLKFFRAASLF